MGEVGWGGERGIPVVFVGMSTSVVELLLS